jgi:murein DD-endopeptidase MepM/ murein hydrolase activator NlpD
LNAAFDGLTQSLARVLPEHEFHWTTDPRPGADGPVTIKVGSWTQLMAIGSAVLVAGWLGVATSSMLSADATTDAALAAKQAELARMQAQLVAAKTEAAQLKTDVVARAEALEARQKFLAALLTDKRDMKKLAEMLPRKVEGNAFVTVADLVAPTKKGKRGRKAAAAQPQTASLSGDLAAPFLAIENQQLAMVDRAAGAAEAKLRDTQALLRRLGLDPGRFTQASSWSGTAVGGPYIPTGFEAEPRFKDLFLSWKKLDTLQAALAAVPAFMPVKDFRYTSGYGFRYDPFNGAGAMHAGVDMAGAHGEPIYASASGTVLQAGRANGYGNLVELSHGKGIDTRYGHLSQILVKPGEKVRQGQIIGRMGSTGRSTGVHLHFEVRIDGRAVNPRPFLDSSNYILAAQTEGGEGRDIGPVLEQTADATPALPAGAPRMTPIRAFR